ncbi:MAG TPA: amidohydrolase family protein [Povalibacter sp.]|uniref:amidohydrolase family protein n=1 Tax=Povalibacter sp. TaxID=1962978 RepID=UPI002C2C1097|nr:amidohydrolase family protein [Povalibacter sp.]HMN47048.1 amidohydrolase family protein [Povalibacter sp.]
MLIRRTELFGAGIADVRIDAGIVSAIGDLTALPSEEVIDAAGGLLLPGLHDHHIHVAALAASLTSVRCGPPDVNDAEAFAARLRTSGTGWLRGIGYHESIAGMLDAATLDRFVTQRPVRLQHRSGRMWFFNSAGLELLLSHGDAPPGLERIDGRYTGRLFDEDAWLRRTLGSSPPSFAPVGSALARVGVTGLTEISPTNDAAMGRHFMHETRSGALPQRVLLAGSLSLSHGDTGGKVQLGPAKLHLHEANLPDLDTATQFIRHAHDADRGVAIHCATEVELVYALAALRDAGVKSGDRIEHASVAPDDAIEEIARLNLAVVTQPHFIRERGDAYRTDVEAASQRLLYRQRAFLDAGVTLAGGSDAPFGHYDPWAAMAAAVDRRTQQGAIIGASEALAPEEALDLFLRVPDALDRRRTIAVGVVADLCLLDRPWSRARSALSSACVRATFVGGVRVFERDSEREPRKTA